jgi:hypothetical protein
MLRGAELNAEERSSFPWWWFYAKWLVPVTAAVLAGGWMGLTLTGVLGVPAALASIGFGPSLFAAMEGFTAMTLIALSVGTMASMAGLGASLLMRGTLLFNTAEANLAQADLEKQNFAAEKHRLLGELERLGHMVEDNTHHEAQRVARVAEERDRFMGEAFQLRGMQVASSRLAPALGRSAPAPTLQTEHGSVPASPDQHQAGPSSIPGQQPAANESGAGNHEGEEDRRRRTSLTNSSN